MHFHQQISSWPEISTSCVIEHYFRFFELNIRKITWLLTGSIESWNLYILHESIVTGQQLSIFHISS